MDIIATGFEGNGNTNSGTDVLKQFISLRNHHPPLTIYLADDSVKEETNGLCVRPKIPRPANAFMLYANENRKKVAKQHPQESNKEISCRLGNQWKTLSSDEKDKYFIMAKEVDAEHKRKYPDYVYNPKEARIRKAMRERERSMGVAAAAAAAGHGHVARPRRSPHCHWPKHNHTTHLLAPPSKEMRTAIRAEMDHGFLSGGYSYQPHPHPQTHQQQQQQQQHQQQQQQQQQHCPYQDYAAYIQVAPSSCGWLPNNYVQGNPMAHQQLWNHQYQADRLRAHQNQTAPTYLINPSGQHHHPEYQQVAHMPANNMMSQISTPTPTPKSIHQNLENAASEVDRYLNMSNDISSPPSISNGQVEITKTVTDSLPSVIDEESNTNLTENSGVAKIETVTRNSDDSPECGNLSSGENSSNSLNDVDIGNTVETNLTSSNSQIITNVPNLNSVANIADVNNALNMTNGDENTENEYTGINSIALFEDDAITSINSQDLHKTLNTTNGMILDPDNIVIPPAHSNYRKFEVPPSIYTDPIQINLAPTKQYMPPFLSPKRYFMDYLNSESNVTDKKEFPINFSAQKYYESVCNANYDSPIMIPMEQIGGYVEEDNCIIAFGDTQNGFSYVTDSRYLNSETSIVNDEGILDLSKVSESDNKQFIDVVDNCSEETFSQVSKEICNELAKII